MSEQDKSPWRPIETAPKDGTEILLVEVITNGVAVEYILRTYGMRPGPALVYPLDAVTRPARTVKQSLTTGNKKRTPEAVKLRGFSYFSRREPERRPPKVSYIIPQSQTVFLHLRPDGEDDPGEEHRADARYRPVPPVCYAIP
jgi:hypothetical protein